ncbi:MAG: tRNA preQ1(34) S-adenosylmethionine ribosyltransferase-isomerase QueA [Chloroflexi bacterium]|nr:MAG: tRNA preQ1(34) S-adenosylmethionine ribosyltransferase-isomerase QueA [Chloroflexota bacterium]
MPTRHPLSLERFDYDLPPDLIAQTPVEPRDASRLLLVDRARAALEDRHFSDLPDLLNPGDTLVLNDTRVLPARLRGMRSSGGAVELLLLHPNGPEWIAMARPARRLRDGERIGLFDRNGQLHAHAVEVIGRVAEGFRVRLAPHVDINAFGEVPLPPYIHESIPDPERYQTVYASIPGSAAAPTAGLHFTQNLLQRCHDRGIDIAYVTLHVGLDTFAPIRSDDARAHVMHSEAFQVSAATLGALHRTRSRGGRIVAVGTTAVRTLESLENLCFPMEESSLHGTTDLYITPGHPFKHVDALITNFHLPRTTLLILVSAFAGEELTRRAYAHAIARRYRFYSFGDAMLIV